MPKTVGDRRDRAAGIGRGKDRADLSRAHATHARRSGGGTSCDSDGGDGGVPVYIVHLSSEDALNQVREARDRGLPAFAETCPQYLLLSLEDVADKGWEGAKYVFTPPLRERRNHPKLWDGLRTDHLQVVSTDHCPFCFADQKALGKDDFTKIPNGGPGIENRLQLLHHHGVGQGNFSINRFVELVSTAPARIFGMYPKKGVLAEAAMQTSCCGILRRITRFPRRRTICASIIPCLKGSAYMAMRGMFIRAES